MTKIPSSNFWLRWVWQGIRKGYELTAEKRKSILQHIMDIGELDSILELLRKNPSPFSPEEWIEEADKLIEKGSLVHSWLLLKEHTARLTSRQFNVLFPLFAQRFSEFNQDVNTEEFRAIVEKADCHALTSFWQEKRAELTEEQHNMMMEVIGAHL
jgi:hypothetical protein